MWMPLLETLVSGKHDLSNLVVSRRTPPLVILHRMRWFVWSMGRSFLAGVVVFMFLLGLLNSMDCPFIHQL